MCELSVSVSAFSMIQSKKNYRVLLSFEMGMVGGCYLFENCPPLPKFYFSSYSTISKGFLTDWNWVQEAQKRPN